MPKKHLFLRLMTGFLVVNILLMGWVGPAAGASLGLQDAGELGAFLEGLMAASMNSNHVPGAVVVVVKDGEVFFSKGYGYADTEKRTPVDPARTLFRPGSVSKLFTWTAVMQLVEQGKLALDEDVNTYLDFTIPAAFGKPITLKNLLTHTPGFEDQGEGLFKLKAEEVVSLGDYGKQSIPARVFAPGTVGAYSNYGAALAGYIVERVSGMPFAEYVEKYIFEPLGMTQATFRQPLPEALAADMSGGYNYANGGYIRGGFEYVVGYPAGSLSAAGLEMSKFMIAHLQNGRLGEQRILKEETAKQMHADLYRPDPRQAGMAYGFFAETTHGQRVISHGGDTLLFHSGLFLLPEQNLGVFLSTNGVNGGRVVEEVFQDFMDHYYPTARPADLLPAEDAAQRAAQYSGEYYSARSNFTTLEKFIRLFNPISVSVDDKGDLLVSWFGEVERYVEVEPGLLVSREHPDKRLVIKQDKRQMMIYPSIPMDAIKTPWYASGSLHLLILGGGGLLFFIALLRWSMGFLGRLIRRRKGELAAAPVGQAAHWVGGVFGLLFILLLFGLGSLFLKTNPAYGVPEFFFSVPGWFEPMLISLYLLIPLAVAMVVLALISWQRRLWPVGGRLYYSVLTVFAVAIVWALIFWKFIKI